MAAEESQALHATIPVTIDPAARAYVEELGLTGPFEQMLRHALETIPELLELEVSWGPPYDMGMPCILFIATRPAPIEWVDDPSQREYAHWKCASFPPDVVQHFTLVVGYK